MYIVEKTTWDNKTVFIGAYSTKAEAEAVASKVDFSYIRYEGELETC